MNTSVELAQTMLRALLKDWSSTSHIQRLACVGTALSDDGIPCMIRSLRVAIVLEPPINGNDLAAKSFQSLDVEGTWINAFGDTGQDDLAERAQRSLIKKHAGKSEATPLPPREEPERPPQVYFKASSEEGRAMMAVCQQILMDARVPAARAPKPGARL